MARALSPPAMTSLPSAVPEGRGFLLLNYFPQRKETQTHQRGQNRSSAPWGSICWVVGKKCQGWLLAAPHHRTSSHFTLLPPQGTPNLEPRATRLSQGTAVGGAGDHRGWLCQAGPQAAGLKIEVIKPKEETAHKPVPANCSDPAQHVLEDLCWHSPGPPGAQVTPEDGEPSPGPCRGQVWTTRGSTALQCLLLKK